MLHLSRCFAIVLCLAGVVLADEPEHSPSLRSIEAALTSQAFATSSLYVRYRYSSELRGDAADATRYLGTMILVDERHAYAMKGVKRYFSIERTGSLADESVTRPLLDPTQSTDGRGTMKIAANAISAYNGVELRRRAAGGGMAAIAHLDRNKSDAQYFSTDYLSLASRTPPDIVNRALTNGQARLLEGILRGECTLRKEEEQIGSHQCLVIDWDGPYKRTFWVAPALEYAIRQQVTYHKDSPLLMWRTTISEFFEPRDGMSWPRKATSEQFPGADAPPELHNRPLIAYAYDVEELSLNAVSDQLFELAIPPGVTVVDFSDGADDAEGRRMGKIKSMTDTGRLVELSPSNIPVPAKWQMPRGMALLIGGHLVLIIAVLSFLLWRKRSRPE
ncbi:MAG: hypothetical protein ACKV0T_12800 [Planctomycetales bacterium]